MAGESTAITVKEDQKDEDLTPPVVAISKKKVAWAIEEDMVLVSAYLNISKDSIVGTDQLGTSFWGKVTKYFAECQTGEAIRDYKSCKNRWHYLNGHVSKFALAYNHANARKKTEESENDVLLTAHKLYESDAGKRFNLEHVWYMLKDDPKWLSIRQESSSKKTKINEHGNYSSSEPGTSSELNTPNELHTHNYVGDNIEDMHVVVRPMEVEAPKRKANAKAMPLVEEGMFGTFSKITEADDTTRGLMQQFIDTQNPSADDFPRSICLLHSKLNHEIQCISQIPLDFLTHSNHKDEDDKRRPPHYDDQLSHHMLSNERGNGCDSNKI